MGALTLLLLVVMLVLGMLVWNAVGGFFDGIGQGITGLGESIGGTVGEGFESLGNTVSGISQGITELGTFVGALPQAVADSVNESLANISETISSAVEDALRTEMRASIETKVLLAESIVPMGTLITASHAGEANVKIGIRSELPLINVNLCGVSVDHVVEGTVEAGIDLSQVSESDFTHDIFANSWVLQLGSAELHSCRIDYIRQQGHSLTVCQQDWDVYRLLAESAALEEIRDSALVEGLLAKAEQEAQIVLGNFLGAVTGSDNISIVFESEPLTRFPESCLREPPTGWTFDEENDSWVKE